MSPCKNCTGSSGEWAPKLPKTTVIVNIPLIHYLGSLCHIFLLQFKWRALFSHIAWIVIRAKKEESIRAAGASMTEKEQGFRNRTDSHVSFTTDQLGGGGKVTLYKGLFSSFAKISYIHIKLCKPHWHKKVVPDTGKLWELTSRWKYHMMAEECDNCVKSQLHHLLSCMILNQLFNPSKHQFYFQHKL